MSQARITPGEMWLYAMPGICVRAHASSSPDGVNGTGTRDRACDHHHKQESDPARGENSRAVTGLTCSKTDDRQT